MAESTDVSAARYEAIRQAIKALAVERDRLVTGNAAPEDIASVLQQIRALSDEGNNIARTLQARRDVEDQRETQRVAQAERQAMADVDARYEAEKAKVAQRRVDQ